jgi:hypothetical protein
MKVNIFEDSIDGEVQDGSINMYDELNKLLKEISYSFGYRNEQVGETFDSDEITNGRLDLSFYQEEKKLKWYLVGYYNDVDYREITKFEFSKYAVAKAYLLLVRIILKNYPEISSYKNILKDYKIECGDFDVFSKDSLITGQEFVKHDPTYYANFKAEWPLDTYLEDTDEIAKSYVIPHDIKFEENYASAHNKAVRRVRQIAKAFQKGTFDGHSYYFQDAKPNISPGYNAYDKVNNIMKTKIHMGLSYYHLHIDGKSVLSKLLPWYEKEQTNFETEYSKKLNEHLTKAFARFDIKYF